MAAALWVVGVGLTLSGHEEAMLGWELMVVAAAASATVMAGIGFILSRGSAEAVYQIGHEAGYAEGVRQAAAPEAVGGGGTVVALPVRYRG